MCNIAGYIGERRAAPILIEMLRAQEGLNAGFYTGIATLHEGKIHYRKVVGNLDDLLRGTDAADLPGTVGVIHSRTPGASDVEGVEFGHPFVVEEGGEVTCAMVLNGTSGFFAPTRATRVALAQSLIAKGVNFRSRCKGKSNLSLPDGTCVHSSEVFCRQAEHLRRGGMPLHAAAARTFSDMPTEAVILMLSLYKQDAITYSRFNFPMHLAYCDHGSYLATTPQAMPQDAGDYHLLPLRSSGYIYKDHFESYPFPDKIATIAPLTPVRRAQILEIIRAKLTEGEQTVETLAKAIRPAFAGYDCGQIGAAIYQILDDLARAGKLKCERRYQKGQFEGLQAPIDYMWL